MSVLSDKTSKEAVKIAKKASRILERIDLVNLEVDSTDAFSLRNAEREIQSIIDRYNEGKQHNEKVL